MKNSKGITLVILVVTIVILLILGGVTANFVLKDNFIDTAKDATNKEKDAMNLKNGMKNELDNWVITK